jgi:hypothetical protein
MDLPKLYAEPECFLFREQYPEDWKFFGCGPGDVGDYLVPDRILGISVRECCRIHDWYYRLWNGTTEQDRETADRIFLNNMLRVINHQESGRWLTRLRSRIAYMYYKAVRRYGAPSFFEERNPNETYRT